MTAWTSTQDDLLETFKERNTTSAKISSSATEDTMLPSDDCSSTSSVRNLRFGLWRGKARRTSLQITNRIQEVFVKTTRSGDFDAGISEESINYFTVRDSLMSKLKDCNRVEDFLENETFKQQNDLKGISERIYEFKQNQSNEKMVELHKKYNQLVIKKRDLERKKEFLQKEILFLTINDHDSEPQTVIKRLEKDIKTCKLQTSRQRIHTEIMKEYSVNLAKNCLPKNMNHISSHLPLHIDSLICVLRNSAEYQINARKDQEILLNSLNDTRRAILSYRTKLSQLPDSFLTLCVEFITRCSHVADGTPMSLVHEFKEKLKSTYTLIHLNLETLIPIKVTILWIKSSYLYIHEEYCKDAFFTNDVHKILSMSFARAMEQFLNKKDEEFQNHKNSVDNLNNNLAQLRLSDFGFRETQHAEMQKKTKDMIMLQAKLHEKLMQAEKLDKRIFNMLK